MSAMSRRAKVYWSVFGLAVGLAVAGVVVGAIGVMTNNHTLMGYMTGAVFADFAVIAATFVIRGGLTKPHPR